MLKANENPPIRPESVQSIGELPGDWWVAHTKARFEKAFAWDLYERGIGYFLPMIRKVSFSGNRQRHTLIPVFPSYVFFCGSLETRHFALTTGRLCQVLKPTDGRELLNEILGLERAIEAGLTIELYPGLAVGRCCRVVSGPLMGTIGTIVRKNEATSQVVLQVKMLGQGASLQIDPSLLEILEEQID